MREAFRAAIARPPGSSSAGGGVLTLTLADDSVVFVRTLCLHPTFCVPFATSHYIGKPQFYSLDLNKPRNVSVKNFSFDVKSKIFDVKS